MMSESLDKDARYPLFQAIRAALVAAKCHFLSPREHRAMTTISLDVNPFLGLCPDFSRDVAQRSVSINLPSRTYSPLSFTTTRERHAALGGTEKAIARYVGDEAND